MTWSRRRFLQTTSGAIFAAAAGGTRCLAYSFPSVDQLRGTQAGWDSVQHRAYRADVVVALMGVPIFSRRQCGAAVASIRQRIEGGRRTTVLSFAGGADPKRTHGIIYSGSTEEIAVEVESALNTAASFGFVTASGSDESFEQARKRVLSTTGNEQTRFTVVDELHRSAGVRIRKTSLAAPSCALFNFDQLRWELRSQFRMTEPAEREIAIPSDSVPATFLYTTLAAMRSPEARQTSNYFHNGKSYSLTSTKSNESHESTILVGRIQDLDTKRHSSFRVWLGDHSDLPVRIEFSPRSYLRITLEHDPTIDITEGV
jgi:hypothetical protein